jgi:transcriptional regulator with XRE-family HTH domain
MAKQRSIGRRLRDARLEAGLSQSKLASASGVPKTRLSRYENDHIIPSVTTLRKVARALRVSEGSLIGDGIRGEELLMKELRTRGVSISTPNDASRAAAAVERALNRR